MGTFRLRKGGSKRRRRISMFFIFCVAFCLILRVAGVWTHSFFQGFLDFTEGSEIISQDVRGGIYDRNYKELATSLEKVSVQVFPREIKDSKKTAAQLAQVLDLLPDEIEEQLKKESLSVWLSHSIDKEEEKNLKKLDISGVHLKRELQRFYPEKEITAHVVGFTEDGIGVAGMEYYYDKLRSRYRLSSEGETAFQPGSDLKHLVLTLDLAIQQKLDRFVKDVAGEQQSLRIGACLIEAQTGALVGMVHYPSYDPNLYEEYEREDLGNILLTPVSIPENFRKLFFDTAQLFRANKNDDEVLPWSVSATKNDLSSELRFWALLGLDTRGKFELNADERHERTGGKVVHTGGDENLYGTVPSTATPMQLLFAYAKLMNGGRSIVPYVAGKIIDESGLNEIDLHPEKLIEQQLENGVFDEIVKLISEQSITSVVGLKIFQGESSQYLEESQGRVFSTNHILMSPVPFDHPELVLMVYTKDARLRPVFGLEALDYEEKIGKSMDSIMPSLAALQQVMKNLSSNMRIEKKEEMNIPDMNSVEEKNTVDEQSPVVHTRVMPNLVGLSLRKSLRLMQMKGVKVRITGAGAVVSQSPLPGAKLDRNTTCTLYLSTDKKL